MVSIEIFNLLAVALPDSLSLSSYEDLRPEGHANYIDRHSYVDTNYYVSSGGRDRMK